jgi:hypothetical protein
VWPWLVVEIDGNCLMTTAMACRSYLLSRTGYPEVASNSILLTNWISASEKKPPHLSLSYVSQYFLRKSLYLMCSSY